MALVRCGYLEPAVTQDLADVWVDNLMRGSDDWDREIKIKLQVCDVFILLVSRHSLASKYILKTEIATIRQRQQNKEDVRCYPLLLTTTPNYALDPVRDWNIRPPNLRPFASYPPAEREEHMAKAADEIIRIAAEIASRKPKSSEPPQPPPLKGPEPSPLPPAAPVAATALEGERVIAESSAKASGTLARQPRNLPFVSLQNLFVGREPALTALSAALAGKPSAGVALHGLGGVGKTRLAIEYALAHAADYSALLFVRADDPATLNANLAALSGAEALDLPEKEAREDAAKIEAVLRWLEAHPTWLLILDNVDDAGAVAAVTKLMPRLTNGHVIVTARATIFPAGLRKLEVDVLDEDSATRFLLDRTGSERVKAPDDEAQAREIAREFDGLALGLEQAGAYIATEKIGFTRYLKLWKESRDKVVGWSLTGSEKTLATVWATSLERLTPESRRLLDRLAMLAPDPIPDSLLDVAFPARRRVTTPMRRGPACSPIRWRRARARTARRALSCIALCRLSPFGQ
jgi:NB-ARC domain